MTRAELHQLIETLASANVTTSDRAGLLALAETAGRLRSWLEHCEMAVAGALAALEACPEHVIAQVTRGSERDATRAIERAEVAGSAPVFGLALEAGDVTGAHLDALARGHRRLEPQRRQLLADEADRLLAVARQSTPEQFERAVAATVRRIEADDGLDRLARQRRATRLRTWVDRTSGMWCLRGEFDPETGARLAGRLRNATDTLFADGIPDTAPSDPLERQDHLRALALVSLSEGGGGAGTVELVCVVDATVADPHGRPAYDWGLPVELPPALLADLAGTADPHVVVVRNGVVLHARGRLDLGRATRIANRAQRRALRALYPTCAIPGCGVSYDHCKIHHVAWWRQGGSTDLENLLPICERHHHAVHNRGWHLTLARDRTLTVTLPDGTRQTTGPPSRQVAA